MSKGTGTFFLKSRKFWALPMLVWLMLICVSLGWNIYYLRQNVLTTFKQEAQTLTEVVLSTMLWAEQHGQVYLPVSEWIPKEPFFAELPSRDVETTCGLRLTQVSPGAIIHQQAELGWLHGLTRKSIRVVSLQPLNPVDAPDKWEGEALQMFKGGLVERFAITGDGEETMFKYMVPIRTASAQTLGEDTIVGGVSVREWAQTRFVVIKPQINGMIISHVFIFFTVGLVMVFLLFRLRCQGLSLDRINEEQKAMIAKLTESELKLEEMSITDELTGLTNRRGFFVLGAEKLNTTKRKQTKNWLVFIDIDGMKSINDNYGHNEGDRALTSTANILKQTFRNSDVIARMGGDEFVVMLSEADTISGNTILTRLQNNIDTYNAAHNANYRLSLSAGIVECDLCKKNCSIGELLKKADELMYENKRIKKTGKTGRETS